MLMTMIDQDSPPPPPSPVAQSPPPPPPGIRQFETASALISDANPW